MLGLLLDKLSVYLIHVNNLKLDINIIIRYNGKYNTKKKQLIDEKYELYSRLKIIENEIKELDDIILKEC